MRSDERPRRRAAAASVALRAAADVDMRLKLSALWASLSFVFAYADLFGLYRPDVRSDIARGELAGFDIDPGFLLGITLYILPAALMVCLSLLLSPRLARVAHLALAPIYATTIAASAVGEWGYYLLASGVELTLLALIAHQAWDRPRGLGSGGERSARADGGAVSTNAGARPIERSTMYLPRPVRTVSSVPSVA